MKKRAKKKPVQHRYKKPKPPKAKPAAPDRRAILIDLILQGWRRDEIIRWVQTKADPPWLDGDAAIDKLIDAAQVMIIAQSTAAMPAGNDLAAAQAQLTDLYKRSMSLMDYKSALAIRREMNRIQGIVAQVAPPVDPAASQPAPNPMDGAIEEILDAILVHLADDQNVKKTYLEIIAEAGAKIKIGTQMPD